VLRGANAKLLQRYTDARDRLEHLEEPLPGRPRTRGCGSPHLRRTAQHALHLRWRTRGRWPEGPATDQRGGQGRTGGGPGGRLDREDLAVVLARCRASASFRPGARQRPDAGKRRRPPRRAAVTVAPRLDTSARLGCSSTTTRSELLAHRVRDRLALAGLAGQEGAAIAVASAGLAKLSVRRADVGGLVAPAVGATGGEAVGRAGLARVDERDRACLLAHLVVAAAEAPALDGVGAGLAVVEPGARTCRPHSGGRWRTRSRCRVHRPPGSE
jgi:hypothetical protein